MDKVMRYEMQWDKETYALPERAAQASGYTKITLTNDQFDEFVKACEESPALSAKLRKAAHSLKKHGIVSNEAL